MRIYLIAFTVFAANQLCVCAATVHQNIAGAIFGHHNICFKRFSVNGKYHFIVFLADEFYFRYAVSYMNFHN